MDPSEFCYIVQWFFVVCRCSGMVEVVRAIKSTIPLNRSILIIYFVFRTTYSAAVNKYILIRTLDC